MEVHHTLETPIVGVGIDIGSSLAKVTVGHGNEAVSHFVSASDAGRISAAAANAPDGVCGLTGAGAASWTQRLSHPDVRVVGEFEAAASGARALRRIEGRPIDRPVLVVLVGTGTSALLVDKDSVQRVGGTALGGGSLLGLGQLVCGTGDYYHLAELAAGGDRGSVDLLVSHIYPNGLEGVPPGLTAANFGRVRSDEVSDLAHALCGLLGENLGLLCGQLARLSRVDEVLYCGATVAGNEVLERILVGTTAFAGASAELLAGGAFCGSLGALVEAACLDGESA